MSDNKESRQDQSALRLGILTTDTLHHTQLVRRLSAEWNIVGVFEEKRAISATFETRHPFEDDRDAYECEHWFNGKELHLQDVCDVQTFCDMNEDRAVKAIKEANCDALLVFGTGKLEERVLNIAPERIVNLHGADPEFYRGLDSHLWTIYHGDFRNLVTTLHKVNPQLDRGGVVAKLPMPIERDMQLFQLRKMHTEVSFEVAQTGLKMMATYRQFISQPQLYLGRHYSFMPAVLKDRCVRKFAEFAASI